MRKIIKARNNQRLGHIFKQGHKIYSKDTPLVYVGKRTVMGFTYTAFIARSYNQVGNIGVVCSEAIWGE